MAQAGDFYFHNNIWSTGSTTNTIRLWANTPSTVEASDDHLLTDLEWLDAEVDEIRELAFA